MYQFSEKQYNNFLYSSGIINLVFSNQGYRNSVSPPFAGLLRLVLNFSICNWPTDLLFVSRWKLRHQARRFFCSIPWALSFFFKVKSRFFRHTLNRRRVFPKDSLSSSNDVLTSDPAPPSFNLLLRQVYDRIGT
jgi:hypothetical protein